MIDAYTETLEAVATAFERGIQHDSVGDHEAKVLAAARNSFIAIVEMFDPTSHRLLEEARCAAHEVRSVG